MKATRIKNALISVLIIIGLLVSSLGLNAQDMYTIAVPAANNNFTVLKSTEGTIKNDIEVITINMVKGSLYHIYFESSNNSVILSLNGITLQGEGIQHIKYTPANSGLLTLTVKNPENKKEKYAVAIAFDHGK